MPSAAPPGAEERERQPLRLRVRPVLTGRLGRLMVGVSAFEFGNVAATLLILRASELLAPGRSQDQATQLALGLYVAYNLAATVASIPAGRLGDRRGPVLVLVLGVALFGLAYAGFAASATSVLALAPWFVAAGVAIGCVETAEDTAVAAYAPFELRGSAIGLLVGGAVSAGRQPHCNPHTALRSSARHCLSIPTRLQSAPRGPRRVTAARAGRLLRA